MVRPLAIPEWDSYVLVRTSEPQGRKKSATGLYPVASLDPNSDLSGGLNRLRADDVVSIVIVTDPLWSPGVEALKAAFGTCTPLKITIALCAAICGARSWEDIEDYGHSKYDWLKTFLRLPNGVPCQDTFQRVFGRLNPQALQGYLPNWCRLLPEALSQKNAALNGESLRRSFDTAGSLATLRGVSVWTAAHAVTFGQLATDQRSNETTAIPTLLQMLDLAGAVVTIDARDCPKERAAAIRKGAGDYVLAVRSDEHLRDDIQARFGKVWVGNGTKTEFSRYQEVTQGRDGKDTCTTLVLGGATASRVDPGTVLM
jgi:hypothetical protein